MNKVFLRSVESFKDIRIRDDKELEEKLINDRYYVGEASGIGRDLLRPSIQSVFNEIRKCIPESNGSNEAEMFYTHYEKMRENISWLEGYETRRVKVKNLNIEHDNVVVGISPNMYIDAKIGSKVYLALPWQAHKEDELTIERGTVIYGNIYERNSKYGTNPVYPIGIVIDNSEEWNERKSRLVYQYKTPTKR